MAKWTFHKHALQANNYLIRQNMNNRFFLCLFWLWNGTFCPSYTFLILHNLSGPDLNALWMKQITQTNKTLSVTPNSVIVSTCRGKVQITYPNVSFSGKTNVFFKNKKGKFLILCWIICNKVVLFCLLVVKCGKAASPWLVSFSLSF